MANSTLPRAKTETGRSESRSDEGEDSLAFDLRRTLISLSSLKITVTLLSMAIFLVVVGTLAQVEKDVWQVVDEYFRTPLAWVHLRVFFPPSFFPGFVVPTELFLRGGYVIPLGFYFPGGWLIGGLLMINLLAAHLVRFPVQARGLQLKAGWAVMAVGACLTWMVIFGEDPASGGLPGWLSTAAAWRVFQAALGLSGLALGLFGLRISKERKLERRGLLVCAAILGGMLAWTLVVGSLPRLGESSMRILWQMTRGQLATFVLLLGCALLFRKKAGIVLLHGGIALLMFGEVLTGLTAVEGHMQLFEGESASYVRHLRDVELAIVDRSGADRDVVVSIPESRLLDGRTIQDDDLPFDIAPVYFLKNSTIRQAQANDRNPATEGIGLSWLAEPARPVSGTEGGRVNMTSAYIAILRKGTNEEIGTHLVGLPLTDLGVEEKVEAEGKTFDVSLRHRRSYKPYTISLIDVQKQDYPGTDIPRHFASQIHLVDDSRHEDRTAKIWMNNPLRFGQETLYQSGYFKDPQTGDEATTLAVVTNTGRMIPYVGCMIVATGLIVQFSIVLLRFVTRRASGRSSLSKGSGELANGDSPAASRGRLATAASLVLPVVLILSSAWLAGRARTALAPVDGFNIHEFGELPVVDHGRLKPTDSLARTSLQILSARTTFTDEKGTRQPAIKWFLDLVARPENAGKHRVFRIDLEVLETLGLEAREGFRYSISEFADKLVDLDKQVELAISMDASELSTFQKKVLELQRKLILWYQLVQAYGATEEPSGNQGRPSAATMTMSGQPLPLAIPGEAGFKDWQTFAQARVNAASDRVEKDTLSARATGSLGAILSSYARGDSQAFNSAVSEYRGLMNTSTGGEYNLAKVDYEALFNHLDASYYAAVLYAGAFLLAALAWLGWSDVLNRASLGLVMLAFGLHLFVLVSRIYISGRPPVTNLYSSAIFIGWAAVLFGIVLETINRKGIGNVTASVIGFATLLVAHFLGNDSDTFAVLQAVLDTQFWLATHVVCITLGYSATYVAGMLGLIYVLRGVLTPSLSRSTGSELSRMIYGTVCFALLFSFVGTVLGGLWADDSWGRFWGWDPKENGALIIVLWNAMVLHSLKSGLVKERGLANLAVAGNIAVSWSWFGVNELGIGLHSYGFTEGALRALGLFVASQLAIVALGLLPLRYWTSHRRQHVPHATS